MYVYVHLQVNPPQGKTDIYQTVNSSHSEGKTKEDNDVVLSLFLSGLNSVEQVSIQHTILTVFLIPKITMK